MFPVENAPQPQSQKHNWITELSNNTVQREQYVNKQFKDRKKAELIEKCNYCNEIKLSLYLSTHIVIKGILFQQKRL